MTLKELSKAISDSKYGNIPVHARPLRVYSEKSANELTKSILAYLEFNGVKAWRQASEGRYIQGKEYTDMFGRKKQEKGMYIPRSKAAKGIGDISAVIRGQFVSIEIKYGKDRMRPEQRQFAEELKDSGGTYIVVKTWDDFIRQIKQMGV